MLAQGPGPVRDPALARELADGLAALGLAVDAARQAQLLEFLHLLHKWNRVYNLTAVRDLDAMLVRHVLDSLAALGPVRALVEARGAADARGPGRQPKLLDVGSGGGLPGIPWAIVEPGWEFTLVDPVQKKTAFLTQAKASLGLDRVEVIAARVEDVQVPGPGYDLVTSRAFAELSALIHLAGHLLAPGGVMAVLKARRAEIDAELRALPPGWACERVVDLRVPGLDEERHLVVVGRAVS